MKKAHFITFEGGEGSGKSTQVARLQEYPGNPEEQVSHQVIDAGFL